MMILWHVNDMLMHDTLQIPIVWRKKLSTLTYTHPMVWDSWSLAVGIIVFGVQEKELCTLGGIAIFYTGK